MAQHYILPSGGTNLSVGTNNQSAPTSSTSVGMVDGSGKLQAVSASNPLPIAITSGLANPLPVSGTFWQATQPVSAASLPLPSGASTEATLSAMSAKLPASLGAKATAYSMAVNIASDQTVPVSGTFWPATQPVSATALPLPTGASTETTLSGMSGKLPATLGQKAAAASMSVILASDQALPLPSGAATETTLAAMSAKLPASLGAKTIANSMAVNIASDQTIIVSNMRGSFTDRSGTTSATPSTSTTLMSANAGRKSFIIQNLSGTASIYINFGSAASATNSILLLPYAMYSQEGFFCDTEAINVMSTTASVVYMAKEA